MADNIKTYIAPHDAYGNPHRILVNESKKWVYDDSYAITPQGLKVHVKTRKALKEIKSDYIDRFNFKLLTYDQWKSKKVR